MNKESFISRLDELLRELPDVERIEAIEYYQEYFDDAGVENEGQVLRELGSPEEVAHNIKADLARRELMVVSGANDEAEDVANRANSTAGENVFGGNAYNGQSNYRSQQGGAEQNYYDSQSNAGTRYDDHTNGEAHEKKKNPVVTGLAIVALVLLAVPVGIPVISAIFAAVVTVVSTVFGLLLSLFIVGAVFLVVGVVLGILAIINIFVEPFVALLLLGIGLLLFGLGALFLLAGWKMCTIVLPAVLRWITMMCGKLFRRRGATVA